MLVMWSCFALQCVPGRAVWAPPASSGHHDASSQEAFPAAVLLPGQPPSTLFMDLPFSVLLIKKLSVVSLCVCLGEGGSSGGASVVGEEACYQRLKLLPLNIALILPFHLDDKYSSNFLDTVLAKSSVNWPS